MSVTDGHAVPVRVAGASVAIGGRPILRGIDLTVDQGEFVALLGVNGSGKSTLVRAITGLLPLTSGALSLFGTPVESFRDWRRIGFVPQRSTASGGVPSTVAEVVASGRVARRRLLAPTTRADREAVARALAAVDLTERAADGISHLSGGQQQRALIARALAAEPDLLVLDEPTAGVDLANQQLLAETLGRLKEGGATVVLVAHEIGPVAQLIDRTVVLRDGRVTYDGPPLGSESPVHQHIAHHHGPPGHHDHVPHVGSPFDSLGGRP